VPLDRLAADLAGPGLPDLAWITPDLCHDTHDCPVRVGDEWLASWVPRLIGGLGPGGILIVTYDEGTSDAGCCGGAAGGRVLTVIAGPGAAPGARIEAPSDHYSILRLIEDHWGLPRLGRAACPCTPDIAGWERR
jgi:phosphatidylinositol-3-phosphatase